MTMDHERVRQLLAGQALGALSGADAEAAEEALAEHVPSCASCRDLVEGFRAVAGDLALAVPPRAAPDTLWDSLRRSVSEGGRPPARRAPLWAAAAAVALLGLAGWNAMLNQRASRADVRRAQMADTMQVITHPQVTVRPLAAAVSPPAASPAPPSAAPRMAIAYVPAIRRLVLLGSDIPEPEDGRLYQLWFTVNGRPVAGATTFVPEDGLVVVRIAFDPSRYEGIWITEEPEGGSPSPTSSPLVAASL
jgi:hypothetical protein